MHSVSRRASNSVNCSAGAKDAARPAVSGTQLLAVQFVRSENENDFHFH
jgi:hypothetical protein